MRLYRECETPSDDLNGKKGAVQLDRPSSDVNRENLIPPVPPVSPAPLAELIALVVSLAGAAPAAVGIEVAGAVGANTAAAAIVGIAATLAASGVLLAGLPIPATATRTRVPVPAPAVVTAVTIVAPALLAFTARAIFGAALIVPTTPISGKSTPLDEDIAFLSKTQIRPGECNQRYASAR